MERVHTSVRLTQAMDEKGMRQVDLLEAVKPYCKRYGVNISKGQLSQYLSGRNEPGQMRIFVLALALDVSEAWLMGLNHPKERQALDSTAAERKEEFERLYESITPEQQEFILQAMRGIAAGK